MYSVKSTRFGNASSGPEPVCLQFADNLQKAISKDLVMKKVICKANSSSVSALAIPTDFRCNWFMARAYSSDELLGIFSHLSTRTIVCVLKLQLGLVTNIYVLNFNGTDRAAFHVDHLQGNGWVSLISLGANVEFRYGQLDGLTSRNNVRSLHTYSMFAAARHFG